MPFLLMPTGPRGLGAYLQPSRRHAAAPLALLSPAMSCACSACSSVCPSFVRRFSICDAEGVVRVVGERFPCDEDFGSLPLHTKPGLRAGVHGRSPPGKAQ